MAALSDIYRYISNPGGVQNPLQTANTSEMSDADYYASLLQQTPGLQYTGSGNNGPQFGFTPGGFLDKLAQNGNATLDGKDLKFSGLPRTRFGDVSVTTPVTGDTRLLNPNLVYDDPNYGRITLAKNIDTGSNKFVGPGLMALAGLGMGSLAGAAGGASAAQSFNTAKSLIGALQGAMKGGYGALLGPLLGQAGVPPQLGAFLSQLARFAPRRGG